MQRTADRQLREQRAERSGAALSRTRGRWSAQRSCACSHSRNVRVGLLTLVATPERGLEVTSRSAALFVPCWTRQAYDAVQDTWVDVYTNRPLPAKSTAAAADSKSDSKSDRCAQRNVYATVRTLLLLFSTAYALGKAVVLHGDSLFRLSNKRIPVTIHRVRTAKRLLPD